jgi:hypothetical protein
MRQNRLAADAVPTDADAGAACLSPLAGRGLG